jgi:hypothetical protein
MVYPEKIGEVSLCQAEQLSNVDRDKNIGKGTYLSWIFHKAWK